MGFNSEFKGNPTWWYDLSFQLAMQGVLDSVPCRVGIGVGGGGFYSDGNVTPDHCEIADFYTETTERIHIFRSDDSGNSLIGFSIWLAFQ
jgi:hypothetical protein